MADQPQERGSFLDELKRRRVFRAAAVYLAVGWAIIEAADTILPRMGAPEWVVTTVMFAVLAGFPLTLVLAWAFDFTGHGVERTPESGGSFVGSGTRPARGTALAALAIVVVFTAGMGWFVLRNAGPPPATEISESTLAVLPFSVRGSDELGYLREGMVELLTRNLEGLEDLTPVDPATILQVVPGDEAAGGTRAAGDAARRLGAGRFVTGSVNEVAGQVRIGAELYSLQDSVLTVARSEVQGDTTELFDLVDRLTAELLAGQTVGMASQGLNRRAALTSHSLPALKEYLEGEKHLRAADFDDAVTSFRRALELDPEFALAHYRMAVAFSFSGEPQAAQRAVDEALDRGDRLSEHDRGLAEALQMTLAGDWDLAEARYRDLLSEYPGDLEAKVRLGVQLGMVAPVEGRSSSEARRHLQEVLEVDPRFLCTLCQLSNLAAREEDWPEWAEMQRRLAEKYNRETNPLAHRILLALDAGDTALADSLIEEGRAITEEGPASIFHDYGHTIAQGFFDIDRSERMLRIYADVTSYGPHDAVLAGEMLNVTRQSGRYAAADHELEVVLNRTPPEDLDGPILAELVLGIEPAASLPDTVLKATRTRLEKWSPRIPPDRQPMAEIMPVLRLYYMGIINARLGDYALADRQAALIESTAPNITMSQLADAMGKGVRAAVAYYQGDMEEVVRVTEDMQPRFPAAYWNRLFQLTEARAIQAEALFAVGRYRDALAWFEWGPPAEAIDLVGLKAFRRGQIYDRLGDPEKAVEHYRNFLKAWEKADPQWQFRLDEARTRIEALTGELVAQ